MADLDTHLHNIETVCAPKSDDDCLHRELNGLSLPEMMTIAAKYAEYVGKTSPLPNLDFDALLTAIPPGVNVNGAGNVNAFKFHKHY
jgi:hypothetical protein